MPADAVPTPEQQIRGYWLGTYTGNGITGNMAYLFKDGGSVRLYDMGTVTDTSTSAVVKANGVYIISGNAIIINVESLTFNGYMNNAFNTILGSVNGTGTYAVYKQ